MTIRDWPVAERPREKLLQRGANALSDAELLAIFLRTGIKGRSAVDLARDLINTYGGLRAMLSCNQQVLCQQPGIGPAKYVQFQAALEIGRRYLAEKMQANDVLTAPDQVHQFLQAQLRDRPYEAFACIYLDNRHRVLTYEELFRGTVNGASVHPREVVKAALAHNAVALIAVHNHPSGVAEPSAADQAITQRLLQALALVEIRLLDHLVVGDGVSVSMAERGLI